MSIYYRFRHIGRESLPSFYSAPPLGLKPSCPIHTADADEQSYSEIVLAQTRTEPAILQCSVQALSRIATERPASRCLTHVFNVVIVMRTRSEQDYIHVHPQRGCIELPGMVYKPPATMRV